MHKRRSLVTDCALDFFIASQCPSTFFILAWLGLAQYASHSRRDLAMSYRALSGFLAASTMAPRPFVASCIKLMNLLA